VGDVKVPRTPGTATGSGRTTEIRVASSLHRDDWSGHVDVCVPRYTALFVGLFNDDLTVPQVYMTSNCG
jgi:hypothetical protein